VVFGVLPVISAFSLIKKLTTEKEQNLEAAPVAT